MPVLILLGILLIVQAAIGLLIFFESNRTKKIEQRIFSLLTLCLLVWTLFNAFLAFVDTKGNAQNAHYFIRANQIAFTLGSISIFLIFIFSHYYPLKIRIRQWQKVIAGFGIAVIVLSPFGLIAGNFTISKNKLIYNYGALSSVFAIFLLVVIFAVFIQNYPVLKSGNDKKLRSQSLSLLAGFSLTVFHAILFIIVLPIVYGQKDLFYVIGYSAPIYFVFFTGYSLLKQGLFDIRLIVARSVAYVFTLGTVALAYVIPIVLLTDLVLHIKLSTPTVIILAVVTLIICLIFQGIRARFNRVTNRIFFRDYYEIQDVLDKLGNLLVASVNPDRIKKESLSILSGVLKPLSMDYLLISDDITKGNANLLNLLTKSKTNIIVQGELDEGRNYIIYNELNKDEIEVAVRLRTKDEDLGYMLLGYKSSGQPFSDKDKRLLTIAADEIAISLQNALRFEEIQQFNITLQQKVDEATLKLRRANDKLKALDETKDDFISMASHQLRTPLTSIKGYISMVLEGDAGKISKTQKDMLGQAFFSSQRMVYLIADLLNVSRLKTGKFVIESTPVNLADIAQQELSQLVETAASKEIKLTYDKPKNFPSLMLDETKTRQVIMNFVDNAIYYTQAGGEIDIQLIDSPQTVELKVVDNGIGVPKAEQHHLFTKFYRAGNARKARPDGTGLGLFMAKKVVLAEGGSIIFESQEGKGSTFGFVFSKDKLETSPAAKITDKKPANKEEELAVV